MCSRSVHGVPEWFRGVDGELLGEREKTNQNKPERVRKGGLCVRGNVVVKEIGGGFFKIIHWAMPLITLGKPLVFRQ